MSRLLRAPSLRRLILLQALIMSTLCCVPGGPARFAALLYRSSGAGMLL